MSAKTIAKVGVCEIRACPCGTFLLTVGPITVRLTPGALGDVTRAGFDAMYQIAPPPPTESDASRSADVEATDSPYIIAAEKSGGRCN